MATKTEEVTRHVSLDEEGRVISRRWHRFNDCSMFNRLDGATTDSTVTEREASLLGLKECAVCARRAEGGPALDILEGFFGEDFPDAQDDPRDTARACLDYLRERNAFITIRTPKENGKVSE